LNTANGGFLLVEEVASLLRCSQRVVHEKTRTRSIPFTKYGRRCLFRADQLEAWLSGCDLEEVQLAGGGIAVRPIPRNGTSRSAKRPAAKTNYLRNGHDGSSI
jgi:excisionase family DNA binding protein